MVTVGNQGILSSSSDTYPVYDVLREILSDGAEVIHTQSSQPLEVDGLLLQGNSNLKLILVNYTGAIKHVTFKKSLFTLQPNEIRVENL